MALITPTYPVHRRFRWQNFLGPVAVSVLLAAGLTLPTAHSIAVSNWAEGLNILTIVAFGGLLTGTLLALVRRLPNWVAHPISIALGVVWVVDRMGALLDPLLLTWRDRATDLLIRSIVLVRTLMAGGVGEDPLLFVAVLGFAAWLLGYATVWMLLRHNLAWVPVLINGLVLFINLTYASPKPPAILFYLFIGTALLLFVHQNYLSRWQSWSASMIEVPDLLGWRFLLTGTVVVLLLLFGTQALPTSVSSAPIVQMWQRLRIPWEQVLERWNQAFSNINAPANAVGGGGFGATTLTLAGARTLGDSLVMEVRSTGPNGAPFFEYWRASAFDRYNGIVTANQRTWADTTGQIAAATLSLSQEDQARTPLDADQRLAQIDVLERTPITQTFTLRQNFSQPTLFAATQPLTVSVPILAKHTFLPVEGQMVPNYTDLALIAAQEGGPRNGSSYDVVSLVGTADKQSLRAAPTEYQEWVQRYLQLPEGTQLDRVRAKAAEVVGDAGNAYDKAERIEAFLRTFQYDDQIPPPPDNRDGVDWFLFDLQRGYCDYFASSMVVMLRSVGVPARLVAGYAGGHFNPDTGVFEVRQNVAHTWPEVYFPGYGWQRFEPTPASYTALPERSDTPLPAEGAAGGLADPVSPSQREIDLAELEARLAAMEGSMSNADAVREAIRQHDEAQWRAAWTRRGVTGVGVSALFGAAWLFYRRRSASMESASQVYRRLVQHARLAGMRVTPADTPQELAAQVAEYLPPHRTALQTMAAAYARERYGGNRPAHSAEASHAWQSVRRPLWKLMLTRWLGGVKKKNS